MKTYITISLDALDIKSNSETAAKVHAELENKIYNTVHAALTLMQDEQLVQMKITNLPPRKGDM